MDDQESSAQTGKQAPPEAGQRHAAAIDVEKLAEKVYRLMLAEVRLAQARGEHIAPRRQR